MDGDNVRAVVVVDVPALLQQLVPREHLSRPAHEQLEQRELLRRQLDLGVAAPDALGGGVELQVADFEHGGSFDCSAADDRAQSRPQLRERERLDQVVVGARVEPVDAIVHRVTSRQEEHRRPNPAGAQAGAGLESVHARQHDVQHNCVVALRLRHPERVFAPHRQIGDAAALAQAAAQERAELRIVLDDERAHRHQRATAG